jgi:hypothetical protein
MKLLDLLRELGTQAGIASDDIALDAEGRCTLTVQDRLLVTLEESPDGSTALFSAMLCRYPDDSARLALFDVLMEAHAFGLGTDDAYFGASRGTGAVFLFKRVPLEGTQPDAFSLALASFVGVLAYWKNEYDSGKLGASGGSGAGAAIPAGAAPGVFA